MKKITKLLAIILVMTLAAVILCAAAFADAAEPEEEIVMESLVSSITPEQPGNVPGSDISMPSGWAGMKITVGPDDLRVTSIGRWSTPDSYPTHNFLIARMDGSLVLDYGVAVADATGATGEGFVYADIEGGVILRKNTSYYVVSDYWGENDKFYAGGVAGSDTTAMTLDGIVVGTYAFYEAPGTCWGPLDMKFYVDNSSPAETFGNAPAPAPTPDPVPDPITGCLVVSVTPTEPGNVPGSKVTMPSGWAGTRITVGDNDLYVTGIGRVYTSDSNATHNALISTTDWVALASAVINAGTGDEDSFVYGDLTKGVLLKANTSYYVMSDYYGESDKFYTNGVATTTGDASIDGVVVNWEGDFTEAQGVSWGPLDIQYEETKTLTTSVSPIGEGNVIPDSGVSMPSGWAGMRITVGSNNILVTSLGRWYTADSWPTHNYLIAEMDGTLVCEYGNAVSTAAEGTPEGFVYADLTNPVELTAGTSYYVVSDYHDNTDKFYANSYPATETTEDATIDGIVIGTYNCIEKTAGVSWGPMDMKYVVIEAENPAPATE